MIQECNITHFFRERRFRGSRRVRVRVIRSNFLFTAFDPLCRCAICRNLCSGTCTAVDWLYLFLGLSLVVYIVFRSLVFGVKEIRKTNFREYALVSAGMLRVCWHPLYSWHPYIRKQVVQIVLPASFGVERGSAWEENGGSGERAHVRSDVLAQHVFAMLNGLKS